MGKNRMSVATIDSPEFLNISSISPLISKCEIKVLYVGENRNRSFITKEVATKMAETLPGVPIIGHFVEDKADFGDHGDRMIIDGEGVHFEKTTKPYGFVAPDAKIWFQKFEDTDEFGNSTVREYLMTEGYLWTEQYKEAQRVVTNGNPQSMELDEKTLKGYWSEDYNRGIEFFIINDAIFSSLCILGEDVEPCFEGANVTSPELSSNFSKSDFNKSLFTMMSELRYTLNNQNEGGLSMENQNTPIVEEVVETPAVEETPVENFSNEEGKTVETEAPEIENITEEFAKKEDEEEKKEEENASEDKSEKEDSATEDSKEDKDDEDSKKKYELLQSDFEELSNKYALLEEEVTSLRQFKADVEDAQKDELINSFYMLSDEDKKDVISNKAEYSLADIKAKLSIICVDKKVDFSLGKSEEKEESTVEVEAPTTYNLDAHDQSDIPAWLKTVDSIHNRNRG